MIYKKYFLYLLILLFLIFYTVNIMAQVYFKEHDTPYGVTPPNSHSFTTDFNGTLVIHSSSYINYKYYKSTDNGNNWDNLIGFPEFNNIFITPNGYYFAARGEFSGKGLLLSTDKGITWNSISIDIESWTIDDLVMDNENRLFILTSKLENNIWYYGIYRSTNLGITWTRITKGVGDQQFCNLYVNKKGTLFINPMILFAPAPIYKSSDHGDSWKQIPGKFIAANMVFSDSDEIYISSYDGEYNIQKSIDDGVTWSKISIPSGNILYQIAITKSGKLITYSYSKGIYTSSDNGATWSQSNSGLPLLMFEIYMCKNLIANPNNSDIYFINDIGIFLSKDEGNTWHSINKGIKGLPFEHLASDSKNNFYLGGMRRLYISSDEGNNWTDISFNKSDIIYVLPNDNLLLLGEEIYISSDQGKSWEITGANPGYNLAPFIEASFNKQGIIIVKNSNKTYDYSEDFGKTWSHIGLFMGWGNYPAHIRISKSNEYFALGGFNGFYYSNDKGITWKEITSYLPVNDAPLYFDFDKNEILYALFYSNEDHPHYEMHFTTDKGLTWTKVGENLDVNYVREFFILDNGNIFVGTGEGLLKTNISSGKWVKISSLGIDKLILTPDNYIAGLSLNANKEYGFIIANNPITGIENELKIIPTNFELSQNFPNPFNPTTNINYSLANEEFVRLSIYDLLGQKIATLVNELQQSGLYTAIWNGKTDNGFSAASGIYIYQLDAGNFSVSKKMILFK